MSDKQQQQNVDEHAVQPQAGSVDDAPRDLPYGAMLQQQHSAKGGWAELEALKREQAQQQQIQL